MREIEKLKEELEFLVKNNKPYEEILKKSQELDVLIVKEMKKKNKIIIEKEMKK